MAEFATIDKALHARKQAEMEGRTEDYKRIDGIVKAMEILSPKAAEPKSLVPVTTKKFGETGSEKQENGSKPASQDGTGEASAPGSTDQPGLSPETSSDAGGSETLPSTDVVGDFKAGDRVLVDLPGVDAFYADVIKIGKDGDVFIEKDGMTYVSADACSIPDFGDTPDYSLVIGQRVLVNHKVDGVDADAFYADVVAQRGGDLIVRANDQNFTVPVETCSPAHPEAELTPAEKQALRAEQVDKIQGEPEVVMTLDGPDGEDLTEIPAGDDPVEETPGILDSILGVNVQTTKGPSNPDPDRDPPALPAE